MTTEITQNPQEIASRINEEHARAFMKARDALSHARAAGEPLIETISLLKNGDTWLAKNLWGIK